MAKTGHPNFDLKFAGPWRGTEHTWSVASSHSGGSLTPGGDVQDFMMSVHTVITSFFAEFWSGNAEVYCAGYSYYNGTDSAAIEEQEFTSLSEAIAAGYDQSAYGAAYTGSGQPNPPETCARLQAPVGLSKTGKPVFLRKYVHYCAGPGTNIPVSTAGQAIAAQLGSGALFDSRVLISSSGKQGTWSCYAYAANHQMQRKRKKASSGSSSLLGVAEALAAKALQAVEDAG